MSNWYIISRVGVDTKAFYPIYVITKHMNAKYINYLEAKDIDFTGANVLLHCVWKKNQYDAWKTLPKKLGKQAKNFWIEFDADNHLDRLYKLDEPKNISRFFYKIFELVIFLYNSIFIIFLSCYFQIPEFFNIL